MNFYTRNKKVIPDLIVFLIGVGVMWSCFNYLQGIDQEFKELTGIIRVIIALATAAISIALPGFVQIGEKPNTRTASEIAQSKDFWNRLKAGGALAVFIIVYLFNPLA